MNQRLRHVLKLHLDPVSGSPFWLQQQQALGFSILDRVHGLDDLWQLGPFDLDQLRCHELAWFIPRSIAGKDHWITGETGGATGGAKTTAYRQEEFDAAFIAPFFDNVGWPRDGKRPGHWLWLGPSGPHIIGKVARRIALQSTGCDGFSVDFDPRWFRRLAAESIARQRYFEHLLEQALHILDTQSIRYLFTTPVVLEALAQQLPQGQAQAVEFVYLGGMSVSAACLQRLGEVFSNALFLSGYGNTLFGVSHEATPHRPEPAEPCYTPPQGRIVMDLVSLEPCLSDAQRLRKPVASGEIGQVVMHRLDESFFLPNVMERDQGRRIEVNGVCGVCAPEPLVRTTFQVEKGIY